MYQVGQKVLYGIHGVCDIVGIDHKVIERQRISYFVLEPVEQPGTRYFIPMDKAATIAKLSPLLTRSDLETVLSSCSSSEHCWITDENQRKILYRDLINGCDRRALVAMIHTLYIHKRKQAEMGRKFHLCDENFLRDAEKLLRSEISHVMNLSKEDAAAYLQKYFQ